jgi:hypothetical protein
MNGRKRPSPALVIAVLALFVSLSGTAVAAGVVPLAKRALSADKAKQADKAKLADNAKRLGGETAAAIIAKAAQTPGPAGTAAGLVSAKQASDSLAPQTGREFVIACDGGKKVISGGFASDGSVIAFDSRPISDSTWGIYLMNIGDGNAGVTLYAVCLG